ncbi:MAG TPA: zinc ribbon domain-containing protein [Candidatus Limnocylindrales bacterium]
MATKAFVCPECGTEVPSGRLSCAACGTLLASVAGAARRTVTTSPGPTADAGSASEPRGDAVDAAAASARVGRSASAWMTDDVPEPLPVPPVLRDWTGPVPPTAAASAPPPPAAVAPPPAAVAPPAPVPVAASPLVPPAPAPAAPAPAADAFSEHDFDALPSSLEPDEEPQWPAPLPPVPGAYVAPKVVPTAVTTSTGRPATATTIAAAGVADGTVASIVPKPRPSRWFSVPAANATPGKAGLFSDLPFRSPRGVAGWAVALGGLVGAVAFVLPWSANGVVGTQNEQTYTGQWGLANPVDLAPMIVAIVVLVLTLVPNRISSPTRGVVLPILVGGWFLGIAWGYATARLGLGWGVDAVAVGGLILVMGGAVGLRRAGGSGGRDAKTDVNPA